MLVYEISSSVVQSHRRRHRPSDRWTLNTLHDDKLKMNVKENDY